MTSSNLAAAFHQAMLATYQEALTIGYRPARFLQMVSEHGGVETARIILAQNNPTEGFGTLWEKQRLDLAIEALVLVDMPQRDVTPRRVGQHGAGQRGDEVRALQRPRDLALDQQRLLFLTQLDDHPHDRFG